MGVSLYGKVLAVSVVRVGLPMPIILLTYVFGYKEVMYTLYSSILVINKFRYTK